MKISQTLIKNLTVQLSTTVQALTLTGWLHFLIHCLNNRFFKLTVETLRTDFSEFQAQNFRVTGTLGAELVSFCLATGHMWIPKLCICTARKKITLVLSISVLH